MNFFGLFSIALCCVLVAGLPTSTPTENIDEKSIEALLLKEKESEGVPPVEITKEMTFVHNYNDTDSKVSSKMNLFGGLENKIQNVGGIQKTILNNRIQYNFYFWLVPKNFKNATEKQEKR